MSSLATALVSSAALTDFCGGEANIDGCVVELVLLMWPYYIFFLVIVPVRAYELRQLPPSYPPQWWPFSHTLKRVLCITFILLLAVELVSLLLSGDSLPYLIASALIHIAGWTSAYGLLAAEYKRYQPVTWVGLRGFWLLTGLEGGMRFTWLFSESMSDLPGTIFSLSAALSLIELSMAVIVVWVPCDLNVSLLGHIQRLLLEHPSEDGMASNQPEYTLHEDDHNPRTEGYQSKRADTPGWIYSVEEELPFRPKVDVLDVFVVAINKGRRIKTVYRIHTRVTTDSDPPMVVEFNTKRRYRELRWLDDKLRGVFEHSSYPVQRASLGSFPPRELTQADPFARQVALREYLRRLSQSPFFYCQEFLDMVGIDPKFNAGRLYESCLSIQGVEQSKVPVRRAAKQPPTPAAAHRLTQELMPWRPPMIILSSENNSPLASVSATPPLELSSSGWTVAVPDYADIRKVTFYRIVTVTPVGTFESRHRFSDFQRLNVHLRDFHEVKPTVSLPRLVRIPGLASQSPERFLEDRRMRLEQFLQSILAEYPTIVVASRFVRTFLKLPAESFVAPNSDHCDTDEEAAGSQRVTPTSVKWSLAESIGDLQQSPTGVVGGVITPPAIAVTVPFFAYNMEVDPPTVEFCCRIDEEWTRFHSFEDFQRLRNDLDVRHAYLTDQLDFPSSHLWSIGAPNDAAGLRLEHEGRRRVLSKWLQRVVQEASKEVIEEIEPLWNFLKSDCPVEV